MRTLQILSAIILLCVIFAPNLHAQEQSTTMRSHAIAMHGTPKYDKDFLSLDYVNPQAPKGGAIKHAALGTFDTLNPHNIKGKAAAGLHLLHDTLMARVWDEPFTLYGLIARQIEVPEDRSYITFYLNPQAKFHDGSTITSDDVLFSFETLKATGRPNTRRIYGLVSKTSIIDAHTIRFDLGAGHDRETVMILGLMPVLSKNYWQDKDFSTTTLEPPMGSGPYKIKEVNAGRQITYKRDPAYWAQNMPIRMGHNNFDTIIYDYYRDDTVAFEAFKSGNYQVRREWDGSKWETSYNFPAVQDGRVVLEELEHNRPEWMRALIFNTRRDLFKDIRVRKALTYAFDFEWVNQNLYHGVYKRIHSYYPNSPLAASGKPSEEERALLSPYTDQLPSEVFGPAFMPPETDGSGPKGQRANLRKAKEFLAEAGWEIKNGGLEHKETRAVFSFEILLKDPNDEKLALAYADSLRKLGLFVSVRAVDSTQYKGRIDQFDFDMTLNRWISTLSPGNEQLLYFGSKMANQQGSRNYAGIKNPVVDALAAEIAKAKTRKGLVTAIHALDRVLTWHYYSIPLYYLGRDLVAHWQPLKRPETTPLYGMVIETWWMDNLED